MRWPSRSVRGERDQALASQVLQVAMPAIAGALRFQIAGVGHAEGADERQCPDIGTSQRDGLRTDAHGLPFRATGQRRAGA